MNRGNDYVHPDWNSILALASRIRRTHWWRFYSRTVTDLRYSLSRRNVCRSACRVTALSRHESSMTRCLAPLAAAPDRFWRWIPGTTRSVCSRSCGSFVASSALAARFAPGAQRGLFVVAPCGSFVASSALAARFAPGALNEVCL